MVEVNHPCTCWDVQTSDGSIRTLGWIDLHEYVSVVTRRGRVVTGFSMGAESAKAGDPLDADYEVQVDGQPHATLIGWEDIRTVTPCGGYDELEALLQSIARVLEDPDAMQRSGEPTRLRYIVGNHEAVEIEIRHIVSACSPHPKVTRSLLSTRKGSLRMNETERPGDAACESALSEAERRILDTYSGTSDSAEAYEAALIEQARWRATTEMPTVPHIDEVIAVLAASGQNIEPVAVKSFVDHGVVEVPGTEQSYSVREWLESGRPPDLVMLLADQMQYTP